MTRRQVNLVKIITLIRHGESRQQVPGTGGDRLTPLGKLQAEITGSYIKTQKPDRLFTSTLGRAIETGESIAASTGIGMAGQDERLCECIPLVSKDHPNFGKFQESAMMECNHRLDNAYAEYFRPGPDSFHDVLVTHGNAIRYLAAKSFVADPSKWLTFDLVHNCSCSQVAIDANGMYRLITYNNTHLLEPGQLTI